MVLGFIHRHELKLGLAFDLRRRARNELEGDAVEVESDFIRGDALSLRARVRANQGGVALNPWEFGLPRDDPAEFCLVLQEAQQTELRALLVLSQEDQPRVNAEQILAIPFTMVVALTWIGLLVPGSEPVIEEQVQLEMHMRPVFGDGFAGIGGAPHDGDRLTGLDGLPDFQIVADLAQVGVERVDLHTFDVVKQDQVIAIV